MLKAVLAFTMCCSLLIAAAISTGNSSFAAETASSQEHHLRLYHTHTGEHIDIVYRRGDVYLPEAEEQLDHFLRDHRTGDVKHYDPRVFDILSMWPQRWGIQARRSKLFVDTGLPGAMNFCGPALPAWRRTVSTCKRTRLIFASLESIH